MKMNFAKKATALAMSVLFAVSMAGCGSSASTAKKVEVTSVEDLADLKIGVQTGTTGDSQASDAVNADSPDAALQQRRRCYSGTEKRKD